MINVKLHKGLKAALALVCAGTFMVGLSACGSSGSSSGNEKVTLLVSTLNNPFFVDLRDGAKAEAQKLGIDLQVSDAQNDSATQQNQAQNAQSQGA
ncbi:MAG: D-ribose ABC transporter substrate-binding protein, partial [Bifidobacteriales bacterium]|nr:D-ribose ABC transporter substrate-binding protein [Bifidobacteriales bacterium]